MITINEETVKNLFLNVKLVNRNSRKVEIVGIENFNKYDDDLCFFDVIIKVTEDGQTTYFKNEWRFYYDGDFIGWMDDENTIEGNITKMEWKITFANLSKYMHY